MGAKRSIASATSKDPAARIAQVILDFVSKIPETVEPASGAPRDRARAIANAAALRASAASGTLALPPGPMGLLTILPDLHIVWRIQTQMVADIAGAFGQSGALSREHLLYCLFKHSAAQAVRDLVVRVGGRYLVRRTSLRVMQRVVAMIGVKVAQRAVAKAVGRWLLLIGAVGVAGYAYYDTAQVAATAISLFESGRTSEGKVRPSRRKARGTRTARANNQMQRTRPAKARRRRPRR